MAIGAGLKARREHSLFYEWILHTATTFGVLKNKPILDIVFNYRRVFKYIQHVVQCFKSILLLISAIIKVDSLEIFDYLIHIHFLV